MVLDTGACVFRRMVLGGAFWGGVGSKTAIDSKSSKL